MFTPQHNRKNRYPLPNNLHRLVQVLPSEYITPNELVSRRHIQVTNEKNLFVVLRCLSHVDVSCLLI